MATKADNEDPESSLDRARKGPRLNDRRSQSDAEELLGPAVTIFSCLLPVHRLPMSTRVAKFKELRYDYTRRLAAFDTFQKSAFLIGVEKVKLQECRVPFRRISADSVRYSRRLTRVLLAHLSIMAVLVAVFRFCIENIRTNRWTVDSSWIDGSRIILV